MLVYVKTRPICAGSMPDALDTARRATWPRMLALHILRHTNSLTMNVVIPPRKSRRIASHLKIVDVKKTKASLLRTDEPLVGDCQVRCPILKVDIVLVVPDETFGFAITADGGEARERL